MRVAQGLIGSDLGGLDALACLQAIQPGLVLAFGSPALLRRPEVTDALRAAFPRAVLAGCSTAGEVLGRRVHNGTLALTAVDLGGLTCRLVHTELAGLALMPLFLRVLLQRLEQAQQTLRENEGRYRAIFEGSSDAILLF